MVADLNGAEAVAVQPGGVGVGLRDGLHAGIGPWVVGCQRRQRVTDELLIPLGSNRFSSCRRIPFSVSVPVLSAHTTSTRASPSIAGNSLTRHCRRPSRTTPTAKASDVISTRPSGTIGTSAPTVRSTDSCQPASVTNNWV